MIIKDEFAASAVATAFQLVGCGYNNENGMITRSMKGTYVYIGATQPKISTKSQKPAVVTVGENTYAQPGIGIVFRPNFGKRKIYFYITLDEGADEWCVHVVKQWGFKSKVLRDYMGLPIENVTEVIERTYDELVRSEMDGFVPC